MDFEPYDNEQLDQLRIDILVEQERREAVATIPAQIVDLTAKYLAGGGDPNNLT